MMTERDHIILTIKVYALILFAAAILAAVIILPDYTRAMECTEFDKCLILKREDVYYLGRPVSHTYTVRVFFENEERTLCIYNTNRVYNVGTYTTVYYTPDRLRYRFKNGFY